MRVQLGRAHMGFSCAGAGVEGGWFVIGLLSLQQRVEVELHREVAQGGEQRLSISCVGIHVEVGTVVIVLGITQRVRETLGRMWWSTQDRTMI